MKTNDLKSGTRVQLRNGWFATLMDNKKGNTRLAEVEGFCTECGSVYSHDIMTYKDSNGNWDVVEHTDKQKKVRVMANALFG
jgi:hypothetical protein